MIEFTQRVVEDADDPLIEELYQFGRAHPLNEMWACNARPYPLKEEIQNALRTGKHFVLVTYADGELRHYVVVNNDGTMGMAAVNPFGDGETPVPEGMQMMEAIMAGIKDRCEKVQTKDPVASHAALYDEVGVEVIQ